MIKKLNANEIFVFGSNLAGYHFGGAAWQAYNKFWAKWGVGEGITGQSYAFPTLDRNFDRLTPESLARSRDQLYATCTATPTKTFLLTKVGCGIAGYPEETMRSLFTNQPANLILPEEWQ